MYKNFISNLLVLSCINATYAFAVTPEIIESPRNIPLAYDVDVVVVGGSSGGVAAAVEASRNGSSVFLLSDRSYLGTDLCGTYRLWLEPGEIPSTTLEKELFPAPLSPATPLAVKRTFDKVLMKNNVQFLFGSYPTDILRDADGHPAGIVMANRAGRQAVRAKVIIDATPRATVARMLGAAFTPYPSGDQEFMRIVIGGTPSTRTDLKKRSLPGLISNQTATEYKIMLPMKDGSIASFEEAEQAARDLTWQNGQLDDSEFLFQIPPDHMTAQQNASGKWPGAEAINLDVFRPAGMDNVFVISGCADISRTAAEKMLRPLEMLRTGTRAGAAASTKAKSLEKAIRVTVAGQKEKNALRAGEIRELLLGSRNSEEGVIGSVSSPERSLPVLGQYDVVVIGGGTSGTPAGIGAARQGVKTLVVEYLHGLGGVGTLGMIGKYWYGNKVGFTAEMDQAWGGKPWTTQQKMEWYRGELRKAGGDLWLYSMGNGVLMDGNQIKGVVVTTPSGRGLVLCHTVIDSTGNAEIAIAAGAEYRFAGDGFLAIQGAGLSKQSLEKSFSNSDWTFVNDSDAVDGTRMHVVGRKKYEESSYDISPLIASRERKAIVGDYTLSPMDIINAHTFGDTIAKGKSNLDSHGYTIHPLFWFYFPGRSELLTTYVPYRCLLPKGLEGILVTGLGSSFQRDAAPIVRMQPDLQNQGYAAGVAAAMSVKENVTARNINIKALQQHLVSKGNLNASVLTHKDWELPEIEQLSQAVLHLASGQDYATVMDAPKEQAIPLLIANYQQTTNHQMKVNSARLLAALGNRTGNDTLLKEVQTRPWDTGLPFLAMGNHGAGLSELDSIILALGSPGNFEATPAITAKLRELKNDNLNFSHFRVCATALGTIGDTNAAPVIAEVLGRPGMSGHSFKSIGNAAEETPANRYDVTTRDGSLKEILLAGALFQCKDFNGKGEQILRQYVNDPRGIYRIYALRILGL